eukprot:1913007-Lingulodinium_polyedra.AAC.1
MAHSPFGPAVAVSGGKLPRGTACLRCARRPEPRCAMGARGPRRHCAPHLVEAHLDLGRPIPQA